MSNLGHSETFLIGRKTDPFNLNFSPVLRTIPPPKSLLKMGKTEEILVSRRTWVRSPPIHPLIRVSQSKVRTQTLGTLDFSRCVCLWHSSTCYTSLSLMPIKPEPTSLLHQVRARQTGKKETASKLFARQHMHAELVSHHVNFQACISKARDISGRNFCVFFSKNLDCFCHFQTRITGTLL